MSSQGPLEGGAAWEPQRRSNLGSPEVGPAWDVQGRVEPGGASQRGRGKVRRVQPGECRGSHERLE